MYDYIPVLDKCTPLIELASEVDALKSTRDTLAGLLQYSRQAAEELEQAREVLAIIDHGLSEGVDNAGLNRPLPVPPSLPDISAPDKPVPVYPPRVSNWPEINEPGLDLTHLTQPVAVRSLLPVHYKLPALKLTELTPVKVGRGVLPTIEQLPAKPVELSGLPVPPLPVIEQVELPAGLARDLTPPTGITSWSPGEPIDELPSPLNTSEWWEARAEQLGLPTNREVTRALDFKQMRAVQDTIADEVIEAMRNGRGSVTGAMIRSIMTNQRLNIYGVDDAPEDDSIDTVTTTVINNFYVDYSNEGPNPPNAPRVSARYWSWFLDIGRSDFDEYLELSLDDLPIEEF